LQVVTALDDLPKGHHLTVLVVVKHRHFCFAAPAPELFHRRLFDFTRSPERGWRNIPIELIDRGSE
jgi:hypothetical protein